MTSKDQPFTLPNGKRFASANLASSHFSGMRYRWDLGERVAGADEADLRSLMSVYGPTVSGLPPIAARVDRFTVEVYNEAALPNRVFVAHWPDGSLEVVSYVQALQFARQADATEAV